MFIAVGSPIALHSRETETFLDSGATHHYFVDKGWFSDYVAITPMSGQAASSKFDIVGTGTVCLQSLVKGKMKPVML
jgi:hypothetical protein